MHSTSSRRLLCALFSVFCIGPTLVQGFVPPCASVLARRQKGGLCSATWRRPGRGILGASQLRCSSEPTWDDEEQDEKLQVPAAAEAGESGVAAKGDAVAANVGSNVGATATRLKPSLQELASKAREEAEQAALEGRTSTSGSTAWKEKLSRRMEAASSSGSWEDVPLPGFNLASVGLKGRWKESRGSFVLDPPYGRPPVGVVHFLGGAFIGSAPHIAYRFFLELLADEGYVIVATPYTLSFNYLDTCASIALRSEDAVMSARKSGEQGQDLLPVVSVGHSGGALLHVLSDCLFRAAADRSGSVLISYNNRPADGSIPQLEEVVAPAAKVLSQEGPAQDALREAFTRARQVAEDATLDLATSGITPRSFGQELLQLAAEGFEVVEQVPGLLTDIAEDRKEFFPSVDENRGLITSSYSCPSSLLISFEGDEYDDNDILLPLLIESGCDASALPSKLNGVHYTPLTPDPLISTPFDSFDPLLPLRRTVRQQLVEPLWQLRNKVLPYLNRVCGSDK